MNQALTAVSLFTGAGGIDIGFEKAGVNVIFANELMKEAAETYKANHPGRTIVNDDINNIIEKMNNYEGTDLVFGGPPCQGFSVAGKMDPDDARSKLIFTFLDKQSSVYVLFVMMSPAYFSFRNIDCTVATLHFCFPVGDDIPFSSRYCEI